MEKKTIIYNFGPDGRDACWAALTSSWTHCSKQQGKILQLSHYITSVELAFGGNRYYSRPI